MKIIVGEENIQDISDKYVVLPLDTFLVSGQLIKTYCVVEHIPITEIAQIEHFADLHRNLMFNYDKRNWNFCEQAIEHLLGRWNRELDTFYASLSDRIRNFKNDDPGTDWIPALTR